MKKHHFPKKDNGSKLMKYEDIKDNVEYAITWNPIFTTDNNKRWQLPIDQFKDWIQKYFCNLQYCTLVVNIEFAPCGRLHMHGTISILNKFDWVQHDLPMFTEYNTTITPIQELLDTKKYKNWKEYINKQQLPKKYCNLSLPYIIHKKEIPISKGLDKIISHS